MEKFVANLQAHFSTPENTLLSILDLVLMAMLVYVVALFLKRNNAKRLIPIFAILF